MTTEVLPLRSYGALDENAARLADALARMPGDGPDTGPVWLFSLSKGSADVRVCFETFPDAARRVHTWISLCGLVGGTPLGQVVPPAYLHLAAAGLGVPPGALRELAAGPGTRLGVPFVPPVGVRTVSVVSCPAEAHLTTHAGRARYRRMAPLGPTDGAVRLPDAVVPGSHVVPVWGSDHYFRVPNAARLLYGLFAALSAPVSASGTAPAPSPDLLA